MLINYLDMVNSFGQGQLKFHGEFLDNIIFILSVNVAILLAINSII